MYGLPSGKTSSCIAIRVVKTTGACNPDDALERDEAVELVHGRAVARDGQQFLAELRLGLLVQRQRVECPCNSRADLV
jgi:hypothetical protein